MTTFFSPVEPADRASRRRLSYWLLLGLLLNALALGYYYYHSQQQLRYAWQLTSLRNLVGSIAVLQLGFPLLYLLARRPRLALRTWLLMLGVVGLIHLGIPLLGGVLGG